MFYLYKTLFRNVITSFLLINLLLIANCSGESDGHVCGCGCGRWIPKERPSQCDENGNYNGNY